MGIDTHKSLPRQRSTPSAGCWMSESSRTAHRSSVAPSVGDRTGTAQDRDRGSLSYGSAAARMLLGTPRTCGGRCLAHTSGRRRRAKRKSDPVDAVAIARVVAADETASAGHARYSRTSSCSWTASYSYPEPGGQPCPRRPGHHPSLRAGSAEPASEAARKSSLPPRPGSLRASKLVRRRRRSCVLRPRSRRPTGSSPQAR
jgi:hypothetical protein